ncbi:MAG: hypothetical protein AB1782_07625 [Cyanobacteriota bacterium]
MHIVILSRKPTLYLNKKLENLAKSDGIKLTIIDPLDCKLLLDGDRSQILVHGKPLPKVDFVIPRMGTTILSYGLSVLRHFELMKIPVLNSSLAINSMLKRYEYLQLLAVHPNINTTKSILIRKSEQIKDAIPQVKGPPAMLKMMSDGSKLGAMLIDKLSTAESFIDVNSIMGGAGQIGQSIIIEEFIKEANGKSINVIVLNNKVIGCYFKIKAFNLKQSATLLVRETQGFIKPSNEIETMAILATQQLNLDFAKVSFLESIDGPKIFEVSFNPQIDIFEKEPSFQIPAKILAHSISCIKERAMTGMLNE